MSEATFTFRVDETLKNDFATAAKARDRTGASHRHPTAMPTLLFQS
ncbi:MAG: hypothetical protein H3C26_13970 [Rhodocyclaceae bacterium]|nr:hypothetical protein [Rhodocyclaceae bacterium]